MVKSLFILALISLGFTSCSDIALTSTLNEVLSEEPAKPAASAPARSAKLSSTARKSSFYPAPANRAKAPSSLGPLVDKYGSPTYAVKDRKRFARATAYSHMENEPGAPGRLNAAGTTLKYGLVRSAAADWSIYPLGTTFKIKGLPYTYVVDDYGSALVGTNTVDIFFPSLSMMRKWGTRHIELDIIRMGDWQRSEKLLRGRRKYRHCAKMYAGVVKNMKSLGIAMN